MGNLNPEPIKSINFTVKEISKQVKKLSSKECDQYFSLLPKDLVCCYNIMNQLKIIAQCMEENNGIFNKESVRQYLKDLEILFR